MRKEYAVTFGDKTIVQFSERSMALGFMQNVMMDVYDQPEGNRWADKEYNIDTTGDFELGISTLEVDEP